MPDVVVKEEHHDAAGPIQAIVRTRGAGVAVHPMMMYRTADGDWKYPTPRPADGGGTAWDIPALPNDSVVQASFAAAGKNEGDRFHVDFLLLQNGQPLHDPDEPFSEDLALESKASKVWAWAYDLT